MLSKVIGPSVSYRGLDVGPLACSTTMQLMACKGTPFMSYKTDCNKSTGLYIDKQLPVLCNGRR